MPKNQPAIDVQDHNCSLVEALPPLFDIFDFAWVPDSECNAGRMQQVNVSYGRSI